MDRVIQEGTATREHRGGAQRIGSVQVAGIPRTADPVRQIGAGQFGQWPVAEIAGATPNRSGALAL